MENVWFGVEFQRVAREAGADDGGQLKRSEENAVADADKSKAEQAARRVAEWLARDEESFQQGSLNEGDLPAALGMSAEEVTLGVDYLENREEVVRFPHPSETPPRVELRPGRGWRELRGELLGGESSA